jgi:hypothetical protein
MTVASKSFEKMNLDFLVITQIDRPFVSCMNFEGIRNVSCTYAWKKTYPTRVESPIKSPFSTGRRWQRTSWCRYNFWFQELHTMLEQKTERVSLDAHVKTAGSFSTGHCASTWLHDVLGPSACLVSTLWGSSTLSPQSSPLFRQVVVDSVHHGVATISEFRSYIQCLNKKQKELVWSLWGSICISS